MKSPRNGGLMSAWPPNPGGRYQLRRSLRSDLVTVATPALCFQSGSQASANGMCRDEDLHLNATLRCQPDYLMSLGHRRS